MDKNNNIEKVYNELSKSDVIGIHKYNHLKEIDLKNKLWNINFPKAKPKNLTELEILQIENYEKDKIASNEIHKQNLKEYHQIVRGVTKVKHETIAGVPVNKNTLYRGFKKYFKHLKGYDFVEDADTLPNIEAIIKYFARDETFFSCKRVLKNIGGSEVVPSFKKGILIIGNFGNCKSTILKCFEIMINHNYDLAISEKWDTVLEWKNIRFKIINTHELVSEYEAFTDQHEKDLFIKKYSGFRYVFDDVKKESDASNFGKKNLIRILFEKRYDKEAITHGTCNYHPNYPNDASEAIKEFGEKYGGHIYDRIFEMYNIIEFKGKSFRK